MHDPNNLDTIVALLVVVGLLWVSFAVMGFVWMTYNLVMSIIRRDRG